MAPQEEVRDYKLDCVSIPLVFYQPMRTPAESPPDSLWDGHESVAAYARRVKR